MVRILVYTASAGEFVGVSGHASWVEDGVDSSGLRNAASHAPVGKREVGLQGP